MSKNRKTRFTQSQLGLWLCVTFCFAGFVSVFAIAVSEDTHRRLRAACSLASFKLEQAHPWKKQLFVKGRKLPAAAVWTGMIANKLNIDEAADNWNLPVDAVREILEYCETNKALLEMEAAEELRRLEEKGIGVAAQDACR